MQPQILSAKLTFSALDTPAHKEWLNLLNSESVRKHLLKHPIFDEGTLKDWLQDKIAQDRKPGCRLRAVQLEGKLAGWCGIQKESGGYEVALVLSPKYWGRGREILEVIVSWAREMGHQQLLAHLPQTRPQAKALARLFGDPIGVNTIQNHRFNTYRIEI